MPTYGTNTIKGYLTRTNSVPAEIRAKLGIGPGSTLEWNEDGDKISVRSVATYSSEDIHKALFAEGPPEPESLDDLKEGIRRSVQERYARR